MTNDELNQLNERISTLERIAVQNALRLIEIKALLEVLTNKPKK